MPIARQSTFTAGATLQADQLNDEFNHIVDAFDGSGNIAAFDGSGNIALWVTYNNTDVAALRIDNSAAGKIASFLNNTTERVSIDSDGQITSLVATGTSPFEVSSTTVNTSVLPRTTRPFPSPQQRSTSRYSPRVRARTLVRSTSNSTLVTVPRIPTLLGG
jgi:hypothetical protein